MKKTLSVTLAILAIVCGLQAAPPKTDNLPGLPGQSDEWWAERWKEQAQQPQRGPGQFANLREVAAKQDTVYQENQPANFFTGKPYDAELGSYVFKYRNYNPETARWSTADPSGFPDGANNYTYVSNPYFELDRFGLDTVTVNGTPTSDATLLGFTMHVVEAAHQIGSSIQAVMKVQWQVASDFSGWIVQQISFSASVYNDSDNSVYTLIPPLPNTYWEAWQVINGAVQFGGIDNYLTDPLPGSTHGQYDITGVVNFYENSIVGGNSPSSWGTISEAGDLKATFNMPSWWSGLGYTHSLSMSWE